MFYYLSGKGKTKKIISKTTAINLNLSQFFHPTRSRRHHTGAADNQRKADRRIG